MTEQLVVEGVFDPSLIVEGVDIGVASFQQFEQAIRKVAQRLPSAVANEKEFAATARAVAAELKEQAASAAALTARIEALKGVTTSASTSFTISNLAANKFRSGLAQMAVQATGTSSAVGSLAQGIAFAFGGGGVVIAAAAAIGALAFAYNKLTQSSRELRTEVDALVKSFQDAQKSDADKMGETIAKVGQDIENTEKKLRIWRELLLTGANYDAEIKRLNNLRAALVGMKGALEDLNSENKGLQFIENAFKPVFDKDREDKGAAARAAAEAAAEAKRIVALEFKNIDALGVNAVRQSSEMAKIWGDNWATGIRRAGVATDEAAEAMDRYRKAAKEGIDSLLTPLEIVTEHINKQREAWHAVTDGIAYVVQVSAGVGAIGEQAAQAALSVLDLADALKEIKLTGLSLTNIFGLVGAGIGVLGTLGKALFGDDATQREHAAILQRNSEALDEVRASINDWNDTIEARASAQADLGAIDPAVLAAIDRLAGSSGQFGEIGTGILDRELKKVGSSLAELDAIARANGIELLDEKGRLVAGALDQLREALALAAAAERKAADDAATEAAKRAAEEWAAGAEERRKRTQEIIDQSVKDEAEKMARAMEEAARAAQALAEANRAAQIAMSDQVKAQFDLKNRLTGVDDPAIILDQLVEALSHSSDTLRSEIGDLNLNTPELREEFRQKMIQWLDWMNSGVMTAADLGLSDQQFTELLSGAADFLDSFKESTDQATGALDEMVTGLLNVPRGLNLAEAEWLARLKNPDIPGMVTSGGGPSITDTSPGAWGPRSPVDFGAGAASKGGLMTTESTVQWSGNLVIQGAGKNADQIAEEVVLRLKRVGNAAFGDTSRWSQL